VKLLLAVFGAIFLAVGVARAETLTSRAFTDAVAAAATAAMPSAKVTVSEDLQFSVRYANGVIATSNLANAYRSYERESQRLDDLIQAQIAALLEAGRDANGLPSPERSLIIPVIRNRQWFEETQRRGQEHTPPLGLLAEPLNSELVVVYAEDRPGTLRILSTRSDVGDRAQLHDLALDNLRILMPKIEMRPRAGGIFLISAGGDFEASLLLTDELWSSGQIKVDGDIVVAVPATDTLFVCGSRNQVGVRRLRTLAADLAKGPNALTPALFVYRNGKFVKFEAD
jgi:uncharacterized protein YtpQ (UPF0354 family)